MARIQIEHVFEDISVEEFWALLFLPAFDQALKPSMGVRERVEMERQETAATIQRKVRVVPGFPLPAPVLKLFEGRELEYVETSTFDKTRRVLDWSAQPNVMPDRIKVSGQVKVVPRGNGVFRTIHGEVKIDVFGLGGFMERGVVESVNRSYEKASTLTREWIRLGKHKNLPNV